MKKYILSAFVAFFSMLTFSQNVEFKAANGKLSEIQKYRIKQLREMKFHVLILYAKK